MPEFNRDTHIYLSPHLDDVALSCGGRVWHQVQAREYVLVVTVFAAAPQPDAPLSPFARELHARWDQAAGAVHRRQEEDLQAIGLLGAEAIHWPYADCIYRTTPDGEPLYVGEEALWGPINPSEVDLVRDLAQRMRALPLSRGTLYAPLSVGRHVDHLIARQAAEQVGVPLLLYEDFPYAVDRGAVHALLAERDWEPVLSPLSEEALQARIAAISCYRSQISTFWDSATDMAAAVRAFAERIGNGALAERYWRPTGP
jgi:LmbE family N-acetylglucosaminyl deacetylase